MFDNRIERFFNYTTLTMRITLDLNCPGETRTPNLQINSLPFYHWTTGQYLLVNKVMYNNIHNLH